MTSSVVLIECMGSDRRIADAARVSYDRHTGNHNDARDARLVKYLIEHEHNSPMRHCMLTVLCEAPEFVARQAYKHVVGIEASCASEPALGVKDHGWNEVSGRYVTFDPTHVWRPTSSEWRGAPARGQSKQGSTVGTLTREQVDKADEAYAEGIEAMMRSYERLIAAGVCREQARAVLPLAFYTRWYWTLSLEAALHFIRLRRAPDAQLEIRELADALARIVQQHFPAAYASYFTCDAT